MFVKAQVINSLAPLRLLLVNVHFLITADRAMVVFCLIGIEKHPMISLWIERSSSFILFYLRGRDLDYGRFFISP